MQATVKREYIGTSLPFTLSVVVGAEQQNINVTVLKQQVKVSAAVAVYLLVNEPGNFAVVGGEILEAELPVTVVNSSRGPGTYTLAGSSYGIVGDDVTDDTAALRTALAAVVALAKETTGHAVLDLSMFSVILVAGALETDAHGGNSQILLPFIEDASSTAEGAENVSITIRGKRGVASRFHWMKTGGAPAGTIIRSTLTGVEYKAEKGIPSIIGGPTEAAGETTFSRLNLCLEDIAFRQPENPQLACVNASHLQALEMNGSIVCDTDAHSRTATVPTTKWAYGIIFPIVNTRGPIVQRGYTFVTGYYCAYVLGEDLVAEHLEAMFCKVGVGHTKVLHANYIGWLALYGCNYHHASVSPTGGAAKISEAGVGALKCGHYAIQNNNGQVEGFNEIYHIWDSGGAYLEATFTVVNTGTGVENPPKLKYEQEPAAPLGNWKFKHLKAVLGPIGPPAMPASGTALTNPYWRTAEVIIQANGAVIEEIKSSGTNTTLLSGLFILHPGGSLNLKYKEEGGKKPTWTWFLID